MRKLINLLFKQKMALLVSFIISILYVTTTLFIPYMLGIIIDKLYDNITNYLLLTLALLFVSGILNYVLLVINNHIALKISYELRIKAFDKLDTLPISYFDNTYAGKILNSVVLNNEQLLDGITLFLNDFIRNILMIIGVLVFLFIINYIIALLVLFLTPLSILVTKIISKLSYKYYHQLTKERGEQTSIINELVKNQKNVIRYNYQDKALERFKSENEIYTNYSLKATFISSIVNPSSRLISSIIYALIAFICAMLIIEKDYMTIGTLATLLSYVNQYTKPFNEMTSIISEIQNAVAAYQDILKFISQEDDKDRKDDLIFEDEKRNIMFDDIFFSYQKDKKLIENFNFEAKDGMKIAIVGESGAGKTTLINLIMRFYDVDSGKIIINNQDISKYSKKSLRDDIGMVLQDTWIKEDTLCNNLTMHNDYSMEEINKVIDAVKLRNFVDSLPLGLDTIISNDQNLSLGQRQLICIARVMLKNSSILLLDEATSNIDILSEQYVSKSLDLLMKNKLTFVVAHRLKTIENADKIIVLKNGHILQIGSHHELLQDDGYYKQLYLSQFVKEE